MTRILIAVLSWLVPSSERPRWREEWLAELRTIRDQGGWWSSLRAAADALPDAVAVRRLDESSRRQPRPFSGIGHDFRDGVRRILASPASSAGVVASLVLGIAVTSSAFALLHTVMFRGYPGVEDHDSLVRLTVARDCGYKGIECWIRSSTLNDHSVLQEGLPTLAGLTTRVDTSVAIRTATEPHAVRAALVSPDYFQVLGVRPALGRAFDEAEGSAANAHVAVIGHSLWQRAFAASPDVLGQFIEVAGRPVQVIGVAPPRFGGTAKGDVEIGGDYGTEIWLPSALTPHLVTAVTRRRPHSIPDEYDIQYVGRLKPGTTLEHARRDTGIASARLKAAHGPTHADAWVQVDGIAPNDPREAAMMMGAFMLVPFAVLAIACVNAGSLLLARGVERARDIAIRLALGASRWRVVRHVMVESLLLASPAAALSVLVTWWLLTIADRRIGFPFALNETSLVFIAGVSLAAAFACGLGPALRAVSSRRLSLGITRTGDDGPGRMRLRRTLVAVQVALSLGLIATAGQGFGATRSLFTRTGPSAADRTIMATFDLELLELPRAAGEQFYKDLLERSSSIPGVESSALSRRGSVWTWGRGTQSYVVTWRPEDAPDQGQSYLGGYVAGPLFETLGMTAVEGRTFVPEDATPLPSVAVVSREFARHVLGGVAVGRYIRVAAHGRHAESHEVRIVGVIDAMGELDTRGFPPRSVYVATPLQPEPALTLYLRSRLDAESVLPALTAIVRDLNPRVPITEVATVGALMEKRYFEERFMAQLLALLGVVALGLAVAGVYAVVSFMVHARSRELGIRIALGAAPHAVVRLLLKQALGFAVIGGGVGAVAAAFLGSLVRAEVLHAPGIDIGWFVAALAALATVIVAASVIPARRALRLDPIAALRTE